MQSWHVDIPIERLLFIIIIIIIIIIMNFEARAPAKQQLI
jgi:hypothetical protein